MIRRPGRGDAARTPPANVNGNNGMPNADDSLPPAGRTLQRAFDALVGVLHERKVRYAIIGGLAMIQHTRVRTTDDIDTLLALPQIAMAGFFEALQARGFQIEMVRNIRELRDEGLTKIEFDDVIVDLMRPLPAYAHVLDLAVESKILGHEVRVSSAEGLIVMKLIADRPMDETDIRDLLVAYGNELDLGYVQTELHSIMEQNDPRLAKLEAWIADTHDGTSSR